VTDWKWLQTVENQDLHAAAVKALESRSEHPLAEAIVNFIDTAEKVYVQHFESMTGNGVRGAVGGHEYVIGTFNFLKKEGISIDPALQGDYDRLTAQAKTVVGIAIDRKHVGLVAIADQLKPTSSEAVEKLLARNIEVYMLTGDNAQTAAAVAEQVGITHYQAELKPDDKMRFVQKLQAEGKTVAMVGDGINDSQALAQADVSVAMGKGSDIAMDVAKMTLITSDLLALPKALKLSQKTVVTIKQNLFWAFIYNVIGIPIAAGILYPINGFLLDPMIAGGAMALSSESVVMNSLRLKGARL
jgi:Cu2+-exporting ATPase